MKAFLKRYWWLILLFLVGVPLIVNIGIGLIPGNGSNDGWLGFWGGYIGATITVCFAWYNTNYQINVDKKKQKEKEIADKKKQKEKEILEQLPFINIDGKKIVVSSRLNLPLENVDYCVNDEDMNSLGHIFPNTETDSLNLNVDNISSLYIRCATVAGSKVFFCYAKGINGCMCYEYNNKWHWYLGECTEKAEKIRERFMKDY